MIGRPPMVIFNPKHACLDGGIFPQETLRLFEGNRLKDHQADQIVGGVDSTRRAEFALLPEMIDIAFVSGQQRVSRAVFVFPCDPAVHHTQWMNLHVLGRVRIQLVQAEVLNGDPRRPLPSVYVNGVPMLKDRRILRGDGLR